jgi:hypothetical protein
MQGAIKKRWSRSKLAFNVRLAFSQTKSYNRRCIMLNFKIILLILKSLE